jgi:hypothetical protein
LPLPASEALALQPHIAEQFAAMPDHSEQLDSKISRAVPDGQLMESAAKNIYSLLAGAPSDLYLRAVSELVDAAEWSELNKKRINFNKRRATAAARILTHIHSLRNLAVAKTAVLATS